MNIVWEEGRKKLENLINKKYEKEDYKNLKYAIGDLPDFIRWGNENRIYKLYSKMTEAVIDDPEFENLNPLEILIAAKLVQQTAKMNIELEDPEVLKDKQCIVAMEFIDEFIEHVSEEYVADMHGINRHVCPCGSDEHVSDMFHDEDED